MSVRCCGEADESNGTEHAQWCQSYDFGAHIAAARREGWAQAIEALRALAAESDVTEPRPWTDQGVYLEAAEALEDLLTLTEEGS